MSVTKFTEIWDWVQNEGQTSEDNITIYYWQRVQEQKQYIYCDVRHVTNDETINMYIHYHYWGPGGVNVHTANT